MELLLANDLKELERLTESLGDFAEEKGLESALAYKLALCLDELATNVISYGGTRRPEDRTKISVDVESQVLFASIEDAGPEFNPLLRSDPDLSAAVEERQVGGLGIYLVKKMMDGVEYERRDGRNILRMFKKLKTEPKS
jgi:anti-sigma regulatory factor (Ser/Thr protein kinase)